MDLYAPQTDIVPILFGLSPLNIGLPAQVYAIKWWMGHFGSATPKPERGWCNNTKFQHLDKGAYDTKNHTSTVKTVKKTINKKTGKVSTTGTKDLKGTQS